MELNPLVRRNLIISLLLGGITLAVYWPVGHYDLVRYDDPLFFVENPEVQSGLNWHSFVWAMSSVVVANWHPVTTLSFVLTHQFFGTNPHAEHLVNVAFHIANALLLFLVLQRMTGVTWRCAMVAAVFALHPLRVESVAWIAERKDVLCVFFLMLTLWAWVRHVQKSEVRSQKSEAGSPTSDLRPPTSVCYWLALLFFALGLMSKAMLVTLPFLLLLLDVWPLNRIQKSEVRSQNLKPLLVEKIPFFLLSAIFCGLTYEIQKNYAAMVSWEKLGGADRVSNAVTSYLQYLVKLFWPAKLAVIYPYSLNAAPDWEIWNMAVLLGAVSVLCLCLRRKPYLAAGWFWYLGTAVPIIGLVQVGETAMADRYTYIPLIGPVIALVWLVSEKWKHEVFQKVFLGISAVALVAALAVTTHRQIGHWKNTTALFEHAIEATGQNASAQSGLGIALEHEGRISEAMVHYRIAMGLNPADMQTYYNMGQLLVKRGDWMEAEELFLIVLARNPNDANAHLMLGTILPHFGRNEEAMQHLETALKINPDSTEALNNLAWDLATSEAPETHDGTRAVQLAERACSLTGYKKTTLIGTLAAAYAEAGRFDEAIATAQKACTLADKSGETDLLKKNRELLELYRAHKSYREVPGGIAPTTP